MKGVLLTSVSFFLLCACESVRTVYDEFGNEVKESQGGEKDLSTHMEEKFNSSFSEKKNAQGVPVSVSNRVSSFQKELDGSSRVDKKFYTKQYDGASTNDTYSMTFAGAGKKYGVKEAYTGNMGERIDKELHPAFATSNKGIHGSGDAYAGAGSRYGQEGKSSSSAGKNYNTNDSYYSHDMESGYIESRRNNTPPPRVMSRDEYYRKSIQDTRTMLGRDSDE